MTDSPASPERKRLREEGDFLDLRFDANGLVTVATSCARSGKLLMIAHMNREALEKTLETGEAWYWSRSRSRLWRKGESSGAIQKVEEMRVDCDQDSIWLLVVPRKQADACHTGRASCFYRRIEKRDDGEVALTFVE